MVSLLVAAFFVLCTIPGVAGVSASPLGQTPNAETLLTQSGQALSETTSFRLEGAVEMGTASRGSTVSMAFPLTGEFVAPDRAHLGLDAAALGFDFEAVMIGQTVWVRMNGESWDTVNGMNLGSGSPAAGSSFMDTQGDAGRYLRDPRVVEEGGLYRITGTIDVEEAIAGVTPPPDLAARFGAPTSIGRGMGMPNMAGSTIGFVYLIDRATMYPSSMELTMTLPDMPSFSGGASRPSEVTITVRITYRDFNDPSIAVDAPV